MIFYIHKKITKGEFFEVADERKVFRDTNFFINNNSLLTRKKVNSMIEYCL